MKYLLAAIFWVALLTPAFSQTSRCGPQKDIVEVLEGRYGESLDSFGVSANGHMLQIYVNQTSGSWTVVVITPERQACMVAAGSDWQDMRGSGI